MLEFQLLAFPLKRQEFMTQTFESIGSIRHGLSSLLGHVVEWVLQICSRRSGIPASPRRYYQRRAWQPIETSLLGGSVEVDFHSMLLILTILSRFWVLQCVPHLYSRSKKV